MYCWMHCFISVWVTFCQSDTKYQWINLCIQHFNFLGSFCILQLDIHTVHIRIAVSWHYWSNVPPLCTVWVLFFLSGLKQGCEHNRMDFCNNSAVAFKVLTQYNTSSLPNLCSLWCPALQQHFQWLVSAENIHNLYIIAPLVNINIAKVYNVTEPMKTPFGTSVPLI